MTKSLLICAVMLLFVASLALAGQNDKADPYGEKALSTDANNVEVLNLVAYDYVNPFYQHGFGIVLGEESQSHIIVDGEKNSLEFASPTDACMQGGSFVQ